MRWMRLTVAGMAWLVAAAAQAQTTVDEGTFRLVVEGREVATETFSIRQTGADANAVVIASGRILYREGPQSEMVSRLQVSGPALRPTAYNLDVTGDSAQRIMAQVTGTRFSARIRTSAGERAREYLVSEGALVAEEGVAHHHYFLAVRAPAVGQARVPVIVPLVGRQVWATVQAAGEETVRVGTTDMRARRLDVTVEGSGVRHIWVDEAGRVLRLEIPARSLVAERTAPPG